MKAELFINIPALLGEGACWIEKTGALWWVDILGAKLHCTIGTHDTAYVMGQPIGTVAPISTVAPEKEAMLVALQSGIYRFYPKTQTFEPLAVPEPHMPINRLNDGKCDPAGRFWVGSMAHTEDGRSTGSLYRLDNGRLQQVLSPVTTSNGLGWSPDLRTMYYIDTPTKRVDAFDYDHESGNISHRRPYAHFNAGHGLPDGMTVDDEGCLWVAEWGGGRVGRWDGDRMVDAVEVPVGRVTSAAFGGANMDELYITTAQNTASPEPYAGCVFVARLGVTGKAAWAYAG